MFLKIIKIQVNFPKYSDTFLESLRPDKKSVGQSEIIITFSSFCDVLVLKEVKLEYLNNDDI